MNELGQTKEEDLQELWKQCMGIKYLKDFWDGFETRLKYGKVLDVGFIQNGSGIKIEL